jgi:hypothetical protein
MSGPSKGAHPEKRQSARRRTLLRGKLVHTAGSFTQDCAIRNLSEIGAQVRVTNAAHGLSRRASKCPAWSTHQPCGHGDTQRAGQSCPGISYNGDERK